MTEPSTQPSLEVHREVAEDGTTVVRVAGEADMAQARAFEQALETAAGEVVVLDLGGVSFMDSTGLRVLLTATAGAAGSIRILRRLQPAVQRLFELAGVLSLLPLED